MARRSAPFRRGGELELFSKDPSSLPLEISERSEEVRLLHRLRSSLDVDLVRSAWDPKLPAYRDRDPIALHFVRPAPTRREDIPGEGALAETIGSLAADGYCCADACVCDAADYGVPQHRVRPFWFGHRRGTPCITWPARTHGPPSKIGQLPGFELRPWRTAGEALAGVADEDLGRMTRVAEHGSRHPNDIRPSAARTQNANPEGCAVLRIPLGGSGKSKTTAPDKPARAVTAAASRAGNMLKLNSKHPPSEHDKPARTVTARDRRQSDVLLTGTWLDHRPSLTVSTDRGGRMGTPGRNQAGGKSDYDNAIVLSELARSLLQGFPPDWVFVGKTKKSRNAQIGMAMPPPLAEAIAGAIVRWRALKDERGRERTSGG